MLVRSPASMIFRRTSTLKDVNASHLTLEGNIMYSSFRGLEFVPAVDRVELLVPAPSWTLIVFLFPLFIMSGFCWGSPSHSMTIDTWVCLQTNTLQVRNEHKMKTGHARGIIKIFPLPKRLPYWWSTLSSILSLLLFIVYRLRRGKIWILPVIWFLMYQFELLQDFDAPRKYYKTTEWRVGGARGWHMRMHSHSLFIPVLSFLYYCIWK